MDDLNFFNQKKKKKKTKKIFDIDEAEEGVKVCLHNLAMAENSLAFILLRLAVQELSQVCHCVLVQFIAKLYTTFILFDYHVAPAWAFCSEVEKPACFAQRTNNSLVCRKG